MVFLGGAILCSLAILSLAVLKQFAPEPSPTLGTNAAPTLSPEQILDKPLALDEPHQTDILSSRKFSYKGYDFRELANFKIRGLLLSKSSYSAGANEPRSVLAPCDLAVSWGPMSTPSVLKNFTFYQKDRFFYYASLTSFSETAKQIKTDEHVANIHIIPANETITSALNSLQPHDTITLKGTLVEVSFKGQVIWKSSLRRDDSGDGACELLYLTELSWNSSPKAATELIPYPQRPPEGPRTSE